MLTDAQIDRYGRQILAPGVGGQGQERLLASRVAVTGDGPAAARARDLIARAGVTLTDHAPDMVVAFDGVRPVTARSVVAGVDDDGLVVVTRVALRRCPACVDAALPNGDDLPVGTSMFLAAIAAAEVLRLLLDDAAQERRTRIDCRWQSIAVAAEPCEKCAA